MLMRNCENYNIMAIDDEPDFLFSLENLFLAKDGAGYGYNVVTYSDHEEAIEELKNNRGKFDLLLLDFQLIDCDGYEVVRRIRKFDKDLHIIFLTAKARRPKDENFVSNGTETGVTALDLIVSLEVQGFFDKLSPNDHFLAMVYSTLRQIDMENTIRTVRDGFNKILGFSELIFGFKTLDILLDQILNHLLIIINSTDAFLLVATEDVDEDNRFILEGKGRFEKSTVDDILSPDKNIDLTKDILLTISEVKVGNKTVINANSMCVPINDVKTRKYIGCMYVIIDSNKLSSKDMNSTQTLLEVYARQASLAINNSILYSEYTSQKDDAKTQFEKLRRHYKGTVDILRNAIDAKNPYTRGHSDRVAQYAEGLGKFWFGNNKEKLDKLKRAGYFHDIGKISVPDEILDKPSRLTELEYLKIKEHPEKGFAILNAVEMFQDILHIIQNHHEDLSGTGYPKGLEEDEIDDMTRIISIADSYDAMTSGRKYQQRKTPLQAINDLLIKSKCELKGRMTKDQSGRVIEAYLYDRNLVNAFIEYLVCNEKPQLDRSISGELLDRDEVPEYVLEIERALMEEERLKSKQFANNISD